MDSAETSAEGRAIVRDLARICADLAEEDPIRALAAQTEEPSTEAHNPFAAAPGAAHNPFAPAPSAAHNPFA